MKKIVINDCYGGFGLSYKAIMRYAELKKINLYAFFEKSIGDKNYIEYDPKKHGEEPFLLHYYTSKNPKIEEENDYYFSYRDIPRDDPDLIRVVEELGVEANGGFAELLIVEIPDDVEWEIEEYDGSEWVSEKHRRWL